MGKAGSGVKMYSWEAFEPLDLMPPGPVTEAFLRAGMHDLRATARFVQLLPYGRNTNPKDPFAVLVEARGTCSTKHALLRRLAIEQSIAIALVLGVYEMSNS